MINYFIGLVVICTVVNNIATGQLSFEEDSKITPKEATAIKKLKNLVAPKIPAISPINNYLNDDLYFVRWLRAKNMEIKAAESMFLDHLKWREKEKIDTIDKEDWSEYENEFPTFTDAHDKEGRPLGEMWMSEWNTRQFVLAGKTKQLVRWVAHLFEIQQRQLYELRAAGKNVSQALLIVDLSDFSLIKTGCPACLPVYVATTQTLDGHYPNIWETFRLVNMPSSFDIIIRLIKPIMRPTTRRAMKTYVSQDQWLPILNAKIDKSQRSARFGGTKTVIHKYTHP